MNRLRTLTTIVLLPALVLGLSLAPPLTSDPGPGEVDLMGVSRSLADLAAHVRAATVHLNVTGSSGSRDEDEGGIRIPRMRRDDRRSGSGFVIDATRGYVVTNAHVAGDERSRVRVTLSDGRWTTGDVVAADDHTDLAVVKIKEGFAGREVYWGDSDALRPGDMVIAIGSPLGLESTTSFGIISATSREVPGLDPTQYQDYLQSDTFIDRGSSGGPLVDMTGAIVGVNTAILGREWQGVSYSVPSSMARYVCNQLIENGQVRRGWLGVRLQNVNQQTAEDFGLSRPYGAVITSVDDGSPGQSAGLRIDDIVIGVNGVEVPSMESLRARVGTLAPGSVAKLRVWRSRSPKTVQVVLGTNPDL